MFRRLLTFVGVALVGFHVWLLGGQAWEGQLADLGLLFRWAAAAGLVWALAALRRRGESMFLGRRGVAVWLLAVLLHGPAVTDRFGIDVGPAVPEAVATLAQVAASAAGIIGLVLLLGVLAARRQARPLVLFSVRGIRPIAGALSPGAFRRFSPRPPPVA